MMTAPFEDREGWEMTAIPLDGSIYLEQYEPPEVKAKRYAVALLKATADRQEAESGRLCKANIHGLLV
jgi:RAT1-interacting protein